MSITIMKTTNFEEKEALQYKKGTPVELKGNPGRVFFIEEYDPMMVPPIWLTNDPKPHYPDELNLKSNLFCMLSRSYLKAA